MPKLGVKTRTYIYVLCIANNVSQRFLSAMPVSHTRPTNNSQLQTGLLFAAHHLDVEVLCSGREGTLASFLAPAREQAAQAQLALNMQLSFVPILIGTCMHLSWIHVWTGLICQVCLKSVIAAASPEAVALLEMMLQVECHDGMSRSQAASVQCM